MSSFCPDYLGLVGGIEKCKLVDTHVRFLIFINIPKSVILDQSPMPNRKDHEYCLWSLLFNFFQFVLIPHDTFPNKNPCMRPK